MRSRTVTLAVALVGLTGAGAALQPWPDRVWQELEARDPALQLEGSAANPERVVVPAVLGGFRTVAADLAWLGAAQAAAEQDLPATEMLLDWTTVFDPRPLYFWLNAARITAYDMPEWRIEAAEGAARVPPSVQRRLGEDQARRALQQLEEAKRFHPHSAALWIEQANLQLNRLADPAGAAMSYRRAWEQPGAPYYAGRLHAELLRRMGRKAEALAWLVRLHPQLPPAEEAAAAGLVLARIRDLERELSVAPEKSYQPARR